MNVADGTNLNVAPQRLTLSPDATISPAIGQVRDFNTAVQYTVTAENGDEQVWTVNVTVSPPTESPDNDITAFALPGQNGLPVFDNMAHTIAVSVPFGTNLNTAPIAFSLSPDASVNPLGTSQQNFANPVQYTVTAENGDEQVWTVNVTVDAPVGSADNDITAFALPGQNGLPVFDNMAHTIAVSVPFGTNLNTAPIAFSLSPDASVNPLRTSQQNFANPVQYTVTAENGDEQVWTVNVTVSPPTESPDNDITAFTLPGQNGSNLNTVNHTITVSVPFGTNLNTAPIAFAISPDASVNPLGTSQQNFANPVQYTVTAENGDEQVWTVNVTVDAPVGSADNDITAFALPGQNGLPVFDNMAHTIAVSVPFGTNLNTAPIAFSLSPDASVSPLGTSQQNFANPVQYTVTAENGDEQVWTVNVTVDSASDTTPPVITLVGGNVNLNVRDIFIDPGFAATDDIDGNITTSVIRAGLPNTNVAGTYTVTYNVSDASGNNALEVTRRVNVIGANRSPIARDDTITASLSDIAIFINVLANDSDPDGDFLRISNFTQPTAGLVNLASGSNSGFLYEIDQSSPDTYFFTYEISDGRGGTDAATVTIIVNCDGRCP